MQFTGQELWHLAPHAMQTPASNCATPLGFFGFGFVSLM
jgi:hypothetical protein